MSNVKKYRKKPVVIEAAQLTGSDTECMEVANWVVDNGYPWLVGNALEPETLRERGHEDDEDQPTAGLWIDPADGALMIRTLEGDMRASHGDWIIRGVHGEFYPCKPDIFAKTYKETA